MNATMLPNNALRQTANSSSIWSYKQVFKLGSIVRPLRAVYESALIPTHELCHAHAGFPKLAVEKPFPFHVVLSPYGGMVRGDSLSA
jgi:hypothetical protein